MNVNRIISSSKTLISSSKQGAVRSAEQSLKHSERTVANIPAVSEKKGFYKNIVSMLKNVADSSPSIKTVSETVSTVCKNIKESCGHSKAEGSSVAAGTYAGLKKSKSVLKDSLKEIVGVNDISLANKELGTKAALLEAGKSSFRLLASGAMSAACFPIPIPGAFVGGWVAGEKIAEKLVGKPISKKLLKP